MENDFKKLNSVSFFCPAYNDQENLPRLIPKVHSFLEKIADKFEIIIIEDGSPDKTAEVADSLAGQFPEIRVIHHQRNMGYGGALKSGFLGSQYDYIMYTDGDNQYDVTEFEPHLHLLENYDILSGYAAKKSTTPRRKFQSLIYNSIIKAIFLINLKDINCSMKIYKRKALDSIAIMSSSAFIDAEMLIKSNKKGFKIAQFPVTQYPRVSGPEGGIKSNVILGTIKEMLLYRFGIV